MRARSPPFRRESRFACVPRRSSDFRGPRPAISAQSTPVVHHTTPGKSGREQTGESRKWNLKDGEQDGTERGCAIRNWPCPKSARSNRGRSSALVVAENRKGA